MCEMLDEVGVRLCKGGVMAKNRAWRRMSVDDWQKTIDRWVSRQRPEDLLNVDIFYDAVTVHGQMHLGEAIWNYAYDRGGGAAEFLKLLAEAAHQRNAPFTLLKNFKVDGQGRIDLKRAGLLPINTCARVLSIRHGIRARATAERLRSLVARDLAPADDIDAVIDAHRVLLGAVLDQQLSDATQGVPLSARILPGRLTSQKKNALRDAFKRVETIIQIMDEGRF